jgi:arylformamidase
MNNLIDISVPLRNGMPHWPDDTPFERSLDMDMNRGDVANLSSLRTSAHVGTHMDAPLHFVKGATSIDKIPLNAVVGRARVIEIRDAQQIRAAELERHDLREGERVLFKTRNSPAVWERSDFTGDFVSVAPDAARLIVERKVRLIGVDYLSIGKFGGDEGAEVHGIILGGGVWVIEGLNLAAARPGDYELICLPLKIEGGEGAPARALLRPLT